MVIPLRRVLCEGQIPLDFDDEFDQAAALIDETITAANDDDRLPSSLPRSVIPLFRDFGRSLRESETLFVQSRHRAVGAPYTSKARQRLAQWTDPSYEDLVDVVGEVNMANIRGSAIELTLAEGQPPVKGKFDEAQEGEILEALQAHSTLRLRVRGTAEYSQADGELRKLVRVDSVAVATTGHSGFTEGVKPIWETLAEIGASVPAEVWDEVPSGLAHTP